MAEGDSKKKRNTAGEESQAIITTATGLNVDTSTGEVLDEHYDIFSEPNDAYDDDEKQGGGGWSEIQESYDDSYQPSSFEASQVRPGKGKD